MKFGIFYEMQLPKPWGPTSEQDIFQQSLDQVELADELGYDYVWEVEHHFLEEYSHSSAPEIFLAAASQRTRQIRLGQRVAPNEEAVADAGHEDPGQGVGVEGRQTLGRSGNRRVGQVPRLQGGKDPFLGLASGSPEGTMIEDLLERQAVLPNVVGGLREEGVHGEHPESLRPVGKGQGRGAR